MDLPAALAERARRQDGVLTRRQLLRGGLEVSQLRRRLGRTYRLILPGVVLLDPGLPSDHQRRVGALLLAGPQSWLSGPTAASLHGLDVGHAEPRVHVLVPAPCRPRDIAWVSIRRTHLLDERLLQRGPLRISCAARAVVDAAAHAPSDDDARRIIIEAVQTRRVRLDDVFHWVEARRPNGRLRLRAAVEEAAAGAWSVPEADLLRLVATSRVLPPAWANPQLTAPDGCRLTTPDVWFDDVGMAVMVHSRRHHAGALDWEKTVEQDADLSAARVVVVGVTPAALARDPGRVLRRIERAYQSARSAGSRPQVVAVERGLGLRRGA